jgi:hypothetical protein
MDNSWLKKRNCGIHMTIRDPDCRNFDFDRMAREFHEMGVNFFSFFAGGYITTYPSRLKESRISPCLEGDVTGGIIRAAHKYGIKAIAMADLSVLPPEVYAEHPDWAMVDKTGKPYTAISGMYTACVMGGYAAGYGRAMVKEILDLYDVDGMKFGGGSYGFNENICHCESCRKSYAALFNEEIPEKRDWDDPRWRRYHTWRTRMTSERVKFLRELVVSVKPDMPVMGNGTCFTDTGWTINSALDMEDMAGYQDMIQVEAQTRFRMNSADLSGFWQSEFWTGEEAAYMTSVSGKPIWIVVSYFKAWPWRRSAIDYGEQKTFLALIAANGASPMVNLSGGPPAVHEDKRGFKAPAEIWRFIRDHNDYFTGDRSGANTAFVYSDKSLLFYGKDRPDERYVEPMRGYIRALTEYHIPFDIISTRRLDEKSLAKYKTLILTNYACMSNEEAARIEAFVRAGGSVIATFETSRYDEDGTPREELLLGSLLGAAFKGVGNVNDGEFGNSGAPGRHDAIQNYYRMAEESPLFDGLDTGAVSLIPAAGDYVKTAVSGGVKTPLTLTRPFIVFPEGLSYESGPDLGWPGAILKEHSGGGKTVYFTGQPDRLNHIVGYEEISLMLANAVFWTLGGQTPAGSDAPDSVYLSLRLQDKRANVHLVNRTGGRRMLRRIAPVYGVKVFISDRIRTVSRAFLLSSGAALPLAHENGVYTATVDRLNDYDIVVFE